MRPVVTIPGVELCAAGTWHLSSGRQTFTRQDLAEAVEAAKCPAVGAIKIKLGHVDPRFDGEPALGKVTGLRLDRSGVKLIGDLTGVPAWLGDIAASAYPSRSVEGHYDYRCSVGHMHRFVLTGLALLGTTAPGVGVLKDIPALYGVAASSDDDMAASNGWWQPSTPIEAASSGGSMDYDDDERLGDVHARIVQAAERGAITPRRALELAANAFITDSGPEDLEWLDTLTAAPAGFAAAAAPAGVSEDIWAVLTGERVVSEVAAAGAYDEFELAKLFPPHDPLNEPEPGEVFNVDEVAAAAGEVSDDEDFAFLFGPAPRPRRTW